MSVTLADGVVLTAEIGFSTSAGSGTVPINSTLSSITWTDVSSDVRSCSIKRGRSSELDSFETGSASIVLSNADRHFDPEHVPYATLPGTSGNFLSGGEINAWPSAGDLSVRVKVKATNLATTSFGAFCGNTDQISTGFRFYTGNGVARLGIAWWDTGTGGFRSVVANADNPTTTDIIWVRVDVDRDNGAGGNDVWFYYSTGGITWTLIGTKVTTATVATPGYNGALGQNFGLGSQKGDASVNGLSGNYYQAVVYTDLTETTKVVDYTATGFTSNTDSTMVASTGETWTVNKSGASPATVVSGPYYGRLTPGRPIRIQATPPLGSATGIFFGFIDQFNQQYTNPSDATASVTASDAFKVMNLITLPSYWEYTVRDDGPPTSWFRFDDGLTPSKPYDTISGKSTATWRWIATDANVPSVADAATNGDSTDSLVVNDTSVSASFAGTKYIDFSADLWPFSATDYTAKTVECWIQTGDYVAGNQGIFYRPGNEFTIALNIANITATNGVLYATWGSASSINTATQIQSTVNVRDGKPHHVVMRWDWATSAAQLWVDGTLATVSSTFTTSAPVQTVTTVGKAFVASADTTRNASNDFTGVIDELTFYGNTALSAAQIAAHYAVGKGTYLTGDTASARVTSLLTMAGWPSDGTNLSTATSTVQGIDTQGKTLLSALKECETADQGRLFIDGSGKVTFISLATTATHNTSQRTFGDSASELPFANIEFVYSDQLIRNRLVVARQNGATATVNDGTSQGQYFIRTDSQSDLINDTDQAMTDIANVRLATYKQPAMRIESLGFTPRADTTIYTGLIGDELGTRITVNRRPQGVGSVISKELLIEGVSHNIGPRSWSSTYNLSPAPLAFFILDSSTFGVLDTNPFGY